MHTVSLKYIAVADCGLTGYGSQDPTSTRRAIAHPGHVHQRHPVRLDNVKPGPIEKFCRVCYVSSPTALYWPDFDLLRVVVLQYIGLNEQL